MARRTPSQPAPEPESQADQAFQEAQHDIASWEAEGGAAPPDEAELTSESVVTAVPGRPRVRPWVWWTLGSAAIIAGLLAASWFLLPIRQVSVTGYSRLTEAQVKRLAGITPNFGWLYYGAWRAKGLTAEPWILSAVVTRQFPDTVTVEVTERQPFLRWQKPDGSVVAIAQDGHELPQASDLDKLPLVSGWGPERLQDAVLVARALARYTVQSVAYTPSGVTVNTAGGTVWSGDLKSLVKYAGSISMYPNKKLNIYPWGVSVQ